MPTSKQDESESARRRRGREASWWYVRVARHGIHDLSVASRLSRRRQSEVIGAMHWTFLKLADSVRLYS
eukprot:15126-Eustigmatos_ZCMA.PRE.1